MLLCCPHSRPFVWCGMECACGDPCLMDCRAFVAQKLWDDDMQTVRHV